ncbi:MAG: glycogen synthase [Granulosicoccus sp.]
MASTRHICMFAAENDVIPGAKVGGIGDVVRDIPRALANEQTRLTVVIPAYGSFHELPDAVPIGTFTTGFRGTPQRIEAYEVSAGRDTNVRYLVLHHPLFAAGGKGRVYCDDDDNQPFATDANKFALFSVAALGAITSGNIEPVDVLHLHDWHSALALALIRFDNAFESLRSVRTVFSIHNLALQGIRPFAQNTSSLQAWFPHLHYDPGFLADPRWPHCINPLASAIRLADKIHTVSPTYAREILLPNDPQRGFHGGEGLEFDLQQAAAQNRLIGIINGIDYPDTKANHLSWPNFTRQLSDELLRLIARQSELRTEDYVAHQRMLAESQKKRPAHIITSVGRLTDQKMALLLQPVDDGGTALERILESIAGRGLFLLLGSGDAELEEQCRQIASRHSQLLYINQYSMKLANLLFANGDLFLMPSSFEPCGISQMLAMKDGQPCLAHSVGGLRDTIDDGRDGFLFEAESIAAQAKALVTRVDEILLLREKKPDSFTRIATAARKKRFNWSTSASRYHSELYS